MCSKGSPIISKDIVDSGVAILFTVELLEFSGDPPHQLEVADKIAFACLRKVVGNELFKGGRARLARERYRRASNLLNQGIQQLKALRGSGAPASAVQILKDALEQLCACWVNEAQCALMFKEYDTCRKC